MNPGLYIKYISLFLMFMLFRQVTAQTPEQAEMRTDRILLEVGNSRHEFGDYKGAIEAFTLAIEMNPKLGIAYNNRGITKATTGDDSGAIEDFTRSIEINENYLPAYLNRAASRYNLGDYYGAIEDYGQVIERDPDNVIAWYGRGISHLQIKYLVGACEDLNNALDLGYDFVKELIDEHCR